MRIPPIRFSPLVAVLLGAVLVVAFFIQFGLISVAFDKLGLTEKSALLLAVTSFLGSAINLPICELSGDPALPPATADHQAGFTEYHGTTLLMVNVGGCLVPVAFSIYLFRQVPFDLLPVLTIMAVVAAVSYRFSQTVPGAGIAIPTLIPPAVAALLAALIDPKHAASSAYIAGTLGVLLGADLLKLNSLRLMRVPAMSLGGAGTFDGVFLAGLLAALLA